MTHMWKSEETYFFDMPDQRVDDVYGKNSRWPLWAFLKSKNPKITDMRWDARGPGLHIIVHIPKYPDSHPHFSSDDSHQLLDSYMEYANMSRTEIHEWFRANATEVPQSHYWKGD